MLSKQLSSVIQCNFIIIDDTFPIDGNTKTTRPCFDLVCIPMHPRGRDPNTDQSHVILFHKLFTRNSLISNPIVPNHAFVILILLYVVRNLQRGIDKYVGEH